MKKLHLYIFHYHLLPGGVTDVIMGWLHLIASKPEQVFPERQIVATVLCGRLDNLAELQASLQPSPQFSCRFIFDENLGYTKNDKVHSNQEKNEELSKALAAEFLQKYMPDPQETLWWVHNYHLGKNVVFTGALLKTIRTGGPKFLLHIHDFPECGRFANYNNLVAKLNSSLYPLSPNVCYSTINKRDFGILKDAGVPQQRLFFLPNPLKFKDLAQAHSDELQFSKNAGRYAPEKPIALYPVRCIRRKNVLELGVLNLLAGEPWNIVCTLPGRSEREKPYSDLVASAFQEGLIQGCCEVGLELDTNGFDMLCASAELILSSSVMEGFGFTYFNPMYWNKALVARYLDVLEGFSHCFPGSIFYRELKIPLEDSQMYQDLRSKYINYIAGLPNMVATELREALEQKLGPETPAYIDFAFFSVTQQLELLQRLQHCAQTKDPFLESCRELNRELLQQLQSLEPKQNRKIVQKEFNEAHLRSILQKVSTCFNEDFPEKSCNVIDAQVLHSFSKLEYNYALLWDESI